MDKNSFIGYAAFLPLSLLIMAVRVLPLPVVFAIGRLLGWAAYTVSGRRRRVARKNLKAAFGERYTAAERERIVRRVFQNLALNLIELLLVPRIDRGYVDTHVVCPARSRLDASVARGRGTILLTAHYGNWELSAVIAAVWGYNMLALARGQKPAYLNAILTRYRQMKGCTVISKGLQIRHMVKALKNRGIIGILGDQSGRQGKEMLFFNRPVFMAEGAFRIAARTGAEVVPAFMKRRGSRHELWIGEPLFQPGRVSTEKDIAQAMARYRDILERFIRESPEQWMWINKRWKHSPQRRVMILSDGRTGHLRQAQAVAEALRRCRPQTVIAESAVEFRSSLREFLLTAAVKLFGRLIGNPSAWLGWALTPDAFRRLSPAYADIVICSGSQTRAAGLLLARDNAAKCVSIMNPAPFTPAAFDLSFIPAHDVPKQRRGIVVTQGALTRIDDAFLADQRDKLAAAADLPPGLKIGIMIGGNTADFELRLKDAQTLMRHIQRFRAETGAYILCTTSRRTPAAIDAFLHEQLDRDPRCLLKVFPNEQNREYAVGGMLAVCEVLVVSGESVSMVSEAAASGKYPLVFLPRRTTMSGTTKHERFLRRLHAQGYIRLTSIDGIADELRQFRAHAHPLKRLDDWQRVQQAVQVLG